MVDEFILVINEKRLRSRLKALRNFYKEIQLKDKSEIERGEIIMHLEYFNRIILELGRKYGTEMLTNDGLRHIRNYKSELGNINPDPNVMHQSYLGLRNILFALMPTI
ncbi:MAG: hypothetical protein HMLIMOIP_001752 [Candidatus Nitrosomirales archaeon]|jgi:hypothetical protein|nr:hypothetical protein [Nitrososphaerales archaeon]